MTAQIKLIIIAVVLAASFTAGWWVNGWRHDAMELDAREQMEERHIAEMQEAAEIIGAEAETQIEVRYEYRTIYKEAAAVVNGVCSNDPDFLRLWRKANRSATNSEADKPNDTMRNTP